MQVYICVIFIISKHHTA